MNKTIKKTLKSSKKDSLNVQKKVKSLNKKEKSQSEQITSTEINNNLLDIREALESNKETPELEDVDMNGNQAIETDKPLLSNFNVPNQVLNKRVIVVKNIGITTKIEDILADVKNCGEIIKQNSLKVRNRGVKSQMLTLEFKTAHTTDNLVNKLNGKVVDGNTLQAEYKFVLIDTVQCESEKKTDTLILKNLPLSANKESINDLIKNFNVPAKNMQIFKKFGKNCCFIKFNLLEDASKAFALLKQEVVDGVKLELKYVSEKKETQSELSNNKLHITNIPFTMKKEELEKEFDMADSIKFPLNSHGKSKGCCFLSFKSVEMAALAFEALQDKIIDGRKIKVEYADANVVVEEVKKVEEMTRSGSKRTRCKKDKNIGSKVTLFNLPTSATNDDITAHFSNAESVNILKRGIAEVVFANPKAAKAAIAMPAFSIGDRPIRKELKTKKPTDKIKSKVEAMEC